MYRVQLFITPAGSATCAANRTQRVSPRPPTDMLRVPKGFSIELIANVPSPRHLTFLPSGDLIVGTSTLSVYIITGAKISRIGTAQIYTTITPTSETAAPGVFYYGNILYVGSEFSVWRIRYVPFTLAGTPIKIASIRQGSIAPEVDMIKRFSLCYFIDFPSVDGVPMLWLTSTKVFDRHTTTTVSQSDRRLLIDTTILRIESDRCWNRERP